MTILGYHSEMKVYWILILKVWGTNCFYLYPKENTLSVGQFEGLRQAYSAYDEECMSGQQGTYVNAACKRQSDMSSSSMCEVNSAKYHQYFDKSQMNTSLLTTASAIAKQLTKTTCSVQDATGQVMMGTIRKALA